MDVDAGRGEAEVGHVVQQHIGETGGDGHPFLEDVGNLHPALVHQPVLALHLAGDAGAVRPHVDEVHALDAPPDVRGHLLGTLHRTPAADALLQQLADDIDVASGGGLAPGYRRPCPLEHDVGHDDEDDDDGQDAPLHLRYPFLGPRAARAALNITSRGASRPVHRRKDSAPWYTSMGRPPRILAPRFSAAAISRVFAG